MVTHDFSNEVLNFRNNLEIKRACRRLEFLLIYGLSGRYDAALRKKGKGKKYKSARFALGMPQKNYNYKNVSTRYKASQTYVNK